MKKTILIVEDEPIVRDSLKEWLTEEGYDVVTIEDGEQAIELIKKQEFAVVVLDLKLPGKDGIQVLKEMREQIPALKSIIITGYPSVETAVEATTMGAIDYLVKPFAPEALEHSIRQAMEVKTTVIPEKIVEERKEHIGRREAEVTTHLYLGQDFFRERNYEAAIKEFEKVLQIAPGNLEARTWLRKAKAAMEEPATELEATEVKPRYCVYMTMKMVSYRICTHNYDCLTCEFDQEMQTKMLGATPELEEALARLKELPGNQRLCRYALKGDVSYRLCSRLFYCTTCEFAQMMDDALEQRLIQRLTELTLRQQALHRRQQSWWWHYWE